MLKIMLAGRDEGPLSGLSKILGQYDNVSLLRVDSSKMALDLLHFKKADFVIVDEQLKHTTGLQFVKNLVSIDPMMNCALISSLSVDSFHEATEGLGVLAQLSAQPDEKQVEDLMNSLNKILDMTG